MLNDFIKLLEQEVKNHSIYVWGGNGQGYPTVNEKWIREKETSKVNAERAIRTYRKAASVGCEKKLKAFDCSGLGFYALHKLGLQDKDINANGLKGKCRLIKKEELKKGCFVFKVRNGRAYHIGYIVDDALNVIEAKGRDYGVIKRPLAKGGWNCYGVPSYFADEIEEQSEIVLHRLLKKKRPLMRGADVKAVQEALQRNNFNCGKIDGIYGSKTREAVKAFQKENRLKKDGIVGRRTATALNIKWGD